MGKLFKAITLVITPKMINSSVQNQRLAGAVSDFFLRLMTISWTEIFKGLNYCLLGVAGAAKLIILAKLDVILKYLNMCDYSSKNSYFFFLRSIKLTAFDVNSETFSCHNFSDNRCSFSRYARP